jgi:hypothetical protein
MTDHFRHATRVGTHGREEDGSGDSKTFRVLMADVIAKIAYPMTPNLLRPVSSTTEPVDWLLV